MFKVTIEAVFDNHDKAVQALSDMEEVVGKLDGDLQDGEVEDLEDH